MTDVPIDDLPGFRRRFLVAPQPGCCTVDLEDDYHRMTVRVVHDGVTAREVTCAMDRIPWTICPGAREQLVRSFTGQPLASFARLAGKTENCTHLFDLALLAGVHALDEAATVIDILVADPVDGLRRAELRRNGDVALAWSFADRSFVTPPEIAGLGLYELRDWIASLDTGGQEAARLLRWASLMAHGRTMERASQDDADRLQSNTCFTFQDVRKSNAVRLNETIRDFRPGSPGPLAEMSG